MAVLLAARATTAGRLRGGRLWLLAVLLGLPVVVQAAILIWGEGRGSSYSQFVSLVDGAYLQFGLPLALIFLGTAALGDEWEGGTAFYLVGLPLPRSAIVVGRWAVSVARGLALVLPAVVLLYALVLARHEGALAHYAVDLLWILLAMVLLALGYGAIFLCLGLALRRPVVAAFVVFAVERFVAVLPRGLANLALSAHVRNLLFVATGEFELTLAVAGAEAATPVWQSLAAITAYVAGFLALGTWLLRRREFTGGHAPAETGASAG